VARRNADYLFVRSEASRRLEHLREVTSVRSSRNVFLTSQSAPNLPSATEEERVRHEAVREMARDCVRREQLAKLTDSYRSQQQYAERRAQQLEMKKLEERRKVQMKEQQEDEWLAHRLAAEEQRMARSFSSSAMREEERQKLAAVRDEHDRRMREERDRRTQVREARLKEKKERAEIAEDQRIQGQEQRRREREALRLRMQGTQAEEDSRRLYQVWNEAEAVLKRRQQELEMLREERALMAQKGRAADDDQGQFTAAREAAAAKKRDAAMKRVEVSQRNYQQVSAKLTRPSTTIAAPRRASDA